ncbi:hypothetical protein PAECIP111891_02063 [Paenibacillus allorhizoplanae]|uniref:Uncharacterized protein n=1 Tax=Paenibacillus allorhizoplanae TaxID=2905648 RepID=A0ABN8G7R7_9BACL|nr:hypothetical protein [Paenibacillus allorhizoplanae]CAH1202222.1 hypothetical protein PAECIP111891_02063 [Paenibacillus allorhizoplanae]
MAKVEVLNPTTLRITATLEDALTMIKEASDHLEEFAEDIITICDKMPEFDYTYFCFYAYDTAALFERMLGIDPKQYLTFSMNAPDAFFYTLYGGMKGLYNSARHSMTQREAFIGMI